MSSPRHTSYGRTATLLVLGVLILTVCAGVYILLARGDQPPLTGAVDDDAVRAIGSQRLVTLLTILLISALLILLFVLGAYLLINVGRLVARDRVGGKPTDYVDAWRNYRLTDEEISAATREDRPDEEPGEAQPGPDTPSSDPDPNEPPSGS
jgi:hypothetical protein